MKYLVKLKPLEPYFLGGERTFDFGETKQQVRSKYFIKSEELPTQTTLLGVMRYYLLENAGLLNSSFEYKDEVKKLIGSDSFDISHKDEQNFGAIIKISPLFLLSEQKNVLVPTPFNHCVKDENKMYNPFKEYLEFEKKFDKSTEKKILFSDFNPKEGITDSFLELLGNEMPYKGKKGKAPKIDLSTHKIIRKGSAEVGEFSVFKKITRVGIRKNDGGQNKNEEGFFKKEYVILNENYVFTFFVELDENELVLKNGKLENTIIYLGQNKSAFKLSITESTSNGENEGILSIKSQGLLEDKNDSNRAYSIYYALSDTFMASENCEKLCAFSIIKTKFFRGLNTVLFENKNNIKGIKKNKNLFNLISAGSVFYVHKDKEEDFKGCLKDLSSNCKKIGLNQIIKIGGLAE
ncbi:MAG: type III-B CRISPR module-associated Cmr3 family protein [Eubacteriaceae bacterium]